MSKFCFSVGVWLYSASLLERYYCWHCNKCICTFVKSVFHTLLHWTRYVQFKYWFMILIAFHLVQLCWNELVRCWLIFCMPLFLTCNLGFIKAIDVSRDCIHLITPVSRQLLENADIFFRSSFTVPTCLFQVIVNWDSAH